MTEKPSNGQSIQADKCCDTCKRMTGTLEGLQALVSPVGYTHLDFENIKRSGSRGCKLCKMIYLERFPGEKSPIQVFAKMTNTNAHAVPSKPKHGGIIDGLRLPYIEDNGILQNDLEFTAFVTTNDPAASFVQVLPLRIPVANQAISAAIKSRLEECQTNHPSCPPKNPPHLPKRVVDVGFGPPYACPRLHISRPSQKAAYVALSYCWGGPQVFTTTLGTLESYTSALPPQLPQTIQDAIQVTRSLGIRYLWVDAFCIIQNEHSDKSAEIRDMGLIYKHATLTIAAASARSVTEGFLQDRVQLPACKIPIYVDDDTRGNIWLRSRRGQAPKEPLDSRAWAFQESLLSSRVLYYGTKDLIWKCARHRFVPVKETHNPYKPEPQSLTLSGAITTMALQRPVTPNWALWRDIVHDYSERALTEPEDRLPALAGLAREFQNTCNDDYIAGIWRSCLVRHLGWQDWSQQSKNRRLAAYRSPGWSWATRQGGVTIMDVVDPVAQVVDVTVTLFDDSLPFGQVKNGMLVLQAPVLRAYNGARVQFRVDASLPDELQRMNDHTSFLLLGYDSGQSPVGLILRPANDGTFLRIGMFYANTRDANNVKIWRGLVKSGTQEVVTII